VNVHSTLYPAGEIRGQILAQGQSVVSLLGSNDGVITTADGHALVTYDSATKNLTYNIIHNVTNATAAHFHGPANSTSTAPPVVFLANSTIQATTPIIGVQTVSSNEGIWYTADLNYINIHSIAFPNGEQRGQVILPYVQYAIPIDGAQDGITTDNLGIALVSISSDNNWADVAVISTISEIDIEFIRIHGPAGVGANASVLLTLSPMQYSLNTNIPISSTIAGYLQMSQAYVSIQTSSYPGGEIRGQLIPIATYTTTTGFALTTGSVASTTIPSLCFILVAACSILFL